MNNVNRSYSVLKLIWQLIFLSCLGSICPAAAQNWTGEYTQNGVTLRWGPGHDPESGLAQEVENKTDSLVVVSYRYRNSRDTDEQYFGYVLPRSRRYTYNPIRYAWARPIEILEFKVAQPSENDFSMMLWEAAHYSATFPSISSTDPVGSEALNEKTVQALRQFIAEAPNPALARSFEQARQDLISKQTQFLHEQGREVPDANIEKYRALRIGSASAQRASPARPQPTPQPTPRPEVVVPNTAPREIVFPGRERRIAEEARLEAEAKAREEATRRRLERELDALLAQPTLTVPTPTVPQPTLVSSSASKPSQMRDVTDEDALLFEEPVVEKSTIQTIAQWGEKMYEVLERNALSALNKTPLTQGVTKVVDDLLYAGDDSRIFSRGSVLRGIVRDTASNGIIDVLHETAIEAGAQRTGDPIQDNFALTFSAVNPRNAVFGPYSYMRKYSDEFMAAFSRGTGMITGDTQNQQ